MRPVALSVTESARIARNLSSTAANRLSTAKTVEINPSAFIPPWAVHFSVSDDSEDFKVLRSVVSSVMVDVVDVLVSSESAAQQLFHDVTVLKNVSAVNSDADVPV